MSISDRIKEARLNSGLTQEQLAKLIGVAKTTVTGYEKGTSEPNIETLGKIMDALKVDANYLYQDVTDFPVRVTYIEMQHINKYRELDEHGKEVIKYMVDKEFIRTGNEKNLRCEITKLKSEEPQITDLSKLTIDEKVALYKRELEIEEKKAEEKSEVS
jgi:putative phage repressor|nr:MAG TPA: Repressor protein CI [Caudoviricetes sp.]